MIRVIAGGKPSKGWIQEGVLEYDKRLKKPFDFKWEFYDEEKLSKFLLKWPFDQNRSYVILLDERGINISSEELSKKLENAFNSSKDVVIIIGAAFGVSEEVRERADFVWSVSKLVFPHELMRVILAEQIYRAENIARGGKYHHGD